jgi:hypothetical protein
VVVPEVPRAVFGERRVIFFLSAFVYPDFQAKEGHEVLIF